MKRALAMTALLLAVCATEARSQTTQPVAEPEVRTFELTPVVPPVPALKYRLQFDFADRRPGNAAPLYADAILLMRPDTIDKVRKAQDAYQAKDFKTFDSLADSLDFAPVLEELDQAGRRPECDWNPPMREMGVRTMLPHLQSLAHGLAKGLWVRAVRQIEQGKPDEALVTLRLGYELGDKITEPTMVSALVSASITRVMNWGVAELMTRPDSPNLYWALAERPECLPTLRRAWDAEHGWIFLNSPTLARLQAGEELSADEWRKALVDEMAPIFELTDNYRMTGRRQYPDPIKDAPADLLQRARQEYAQTHHLAPDQADHVDPAIALGTFYFHQWELASDRVTKVRNLPYPELLARTAETRAYLADLRKQQPTNPCILLVSDFNKAAWDFARTDRERAALMAVEAIRSFAAAHGGALPRSLADVTDTPVLPNPVTGRPFEYRVENDTATLSDPTPQAPMTYTIKIRK